MRLKKLRIVSAVRKLKPQAWNIIHFSSELNQLFETWCRLSNTSNTRERNTQLNVRPVTRCAFFVVILEEVDNIRMDLLEVGCGYMDWIGLAQDRDRW